MKWRYEVRPCEVIQGQASRSAVGWRVVEIRPSGERFMMTCFEKYEGAAHEAARLRRMAYDERAA